jgi:hypothetical protein
MLGPLIRSHWAIENSLAADLRIRDLRGQANRHNSRQFFYLPLRFFEVGCVEALGEPSVDRN